MDDTILFSLAILFAAAALGALFWRLGHGTRMRRERERRPARRHRQVTRLYREERSRPGE